MLKYILLLFFFLPQILFTQETFQREKRDYQWILGDKSHPDWPNFGATIFDFSIEPPNIYKQNNIINFDIVNASICDTTGQYLFHTNGISIVNKDAQLLINGARINPGNFTDGWVNIGVPLDQGALILPLPENDSLYYLFHETREWAFNHPGGYMSTVNFFYYSIVNMAASNDRGEVIEKDIPFIEGVIDSTGVTDLDFGKITAIRHGNGRDWWITIPKFYSNEYYIMLFDHEGLHPPKSQAIGGILPAGVGQGVFSPDGLKYVNISLFMFEENYIGVYRFDRSIGEFTEAQIMFDDFFAVAGGGAISENSRFLYYTNYLKIYQYDLEAEDIEASKTLVAEFDEDFTSPPLDAGVKFFMAQLAPNGKIYICSNTQVKYYSVIHEPNKKGLACRAEPHGVELETYNAFSIPNFPYYGLGPLDGSPADTLNIDNPPPTVRFEYVKDSSDVHDIAFFDSSLFPPEATDFMPLPDAYSWDFGDGDMSNEKHPLHTYAADGIYEVCLTVTNMSGSDAICETLYINVVGTDEVDLPIQYVKLHPNPVSDIFYLSYLSSQEGEVALFDNLGREVRRRVLKKGNILQEWKVGNMQSGVYYLQGYIDGKFVFVQRIIISK